MVVCYSHLNAGYITAMKGSYLINLMYICIIHSSKPTDCKLIQLKAFQLYYEIERQKTDEATKQWYLSLKAPFTEA